MTGEPLLYQVSDLCRLLSISRSSFFNLQSLGRIGPIPIRLNKKLLHVRSEIEAWISARDPKTGKLPTREQWLAILREKER